MAGGSGRGLAGRCRSGRLQCRRRPGRRRHPHRACSTPLARAAFQVDGRLLRREQPLRPSRTARRRPLAALVGARASVSGACVVVCAGTATTIDVLSADGEFRGGLILPGFDLMRAALANNTAQLPLAEGVSPAAA